MKGQVVLVTGAASGIGLATAKTFARDGARVLLLDRSSNVVEIAEEMSSQGHAAIPYTVDLADADHLHSVATSIVSEHGGCDVLVNNAGIHPKSDGRIRPLESIGLEEWDAVLRVNLTAPFLLAQRFLPGMKDRRRGRVINVSSRAGRTYSDRAGTHYVASKAGLVGLTRKIAGDYAAYGITANCIAPGQVSNAMAAQSSSTVLEAATRDALVGRLGTPEEVAATIRFLASDEASYITGAVIDVNGGAFIG